MNTNACNKKRKFKVTIKQTNEIKPNEKKVTGLKRDEKQEKYYTKKTIVNICLELFKKHIKIHPNDLCIEPSAGNGSFINGIKSLFDHYIFYDLEPEHTDIIEQNYLEFDSKPIENKYNKIHNVGNPPFGRQSSLAIKFIKKSASYCDSIAFILPKSFKKNSLKKHFPLHFHLVCEYDLPENSFTVHGCPHNVPCVFQIWEKRDSERKTEPTKKENNFKFINKEIIIIDENIDNKLKILYMKDQNNKNRTNYKFSIWKSKFINTNKTKRETIVKKLKNNIK